VPWSPSRDEIRFAACDSLAFAGVIYGVRPDGDLEYAGTRPGSGWHVNGWFFRWIRLLHRGRLRRYRLWKRRWWNPELRVGCHSRPPDELGAVSTCLLVVMLMLYAVLDGSEGIETCRPVHEDMEDAFSPRTMRRWLDRAVRASQALQTALRRAVIERCEPRPVEHLFPGGLSPPEGLLRRRWKDPSSVFALWRGIAFLLGGAVRLDVHAALLLAEARGRTSHPTSPWF
jgi:hypothetical protein